mmetsp:Transcript_8510/g.29234  ORF Transcript_8510/g.29234 Transcript_8510/m.29234 type:complete len:243 (+) Transcript_8510:299-1027(+)
MSNFSRNLHPETRTSFKPWRWCRASTSAHDPSALSLRNRVSRAPNPGLFSSEYLAISVSRLLPRYIFFRRGSEARVSTSDQSEIRFSSRWRASTPPKLRSTSSHLKDAILLPATWSSLKFGMLAEMHATVCQSTRQLFSTRARRLAKTTPPAADPAQSMSFRLMSRSVSLGSSADSRATSLQLPRRVDERSSSAILGTTSETSPAGPMWVRLDPFRYTALSSSSTLCCLKIESWPTSVTGSL